MIKFFRNIRKNLLAEGKTANYLKYAIGEIVLVVIGILIALQINNWNENKKERKQEHKVLTELLSSLENNYTSMVSDSLNRVTWNTSSNIVINFLESDLPYSDTLNIHFQHARKPGTNLSLSYAGYEGLKNVGYDIITSDSLRKSIVELFELTHKALLEEMEYFESFQPNRQSNIDRLFSYDDKNFNLNEPFNVPLKPNNIDTLKNDSIYLSLIKSVKIQRNIISVILYKNLSETNKVMKLLKEELSK
ncbi:DUF6090 family protein [Tamlana flava]|uniref:DUF6090 family protein n=1 Tax=Tamlana flava TaxID=3158572 RepID=UPI00351B2418